MSFASTAAVLSSIVARIEALTPSEIAGHDDAFRATAAINALITSGQRAVLVEGSAGIRKVGGNRNCNEWLTQINITQFYNDVPTEDGAQTVMQRAIQDCEDILADLYTWATAEPGIYGLEADLATPQDNGDGELQITRTIRVAFART